VSKGKAVWKLAAGENSAGWHRLLTFLAATDGRPFTNPLDSRTIFLGNPVTLSAGDSFVVLSHLYL
jgi:hypothetical protein